MLFSRHNMFLANLGNMGLLFLYMISSLEEWHKQVLHIEMPNYERLK